MGPVELKFTQADALAAYQSWRCTCGPAALAAALGLTLDAVRPACEAAGFGGKVTWMSPTMMAAAVANAGGAITRRHPMEARSRLFPGAGLARIQFGGPWCEPGANPKWAYWHTHWVAAWRGGVGHGRTTVFDVNGGLLPLRRGRRTSCRC
jgi:hypothetical protein